ncbi:MAG: TetM/TetW/TetO/TetS family tetracycline resistance ribosomal protection protein [Clostridia bacterium]|nr:TetM/TetW/TetO/TetS family tetracycline resistance ribosomal protection protein [Clostridia bacterium]
MKHAVIGILAHVDAGKTTFAEALLYKTGAIRKQGRVDDKNTLLDNHILEKERGITIFASQAEIEFRSLHITLLDTPGHVDFSTETERILQALDYAVLIVSGLDGVQSHTRTLWNLLKIYHVPAFLFITKMDFARRTRDELMQTIREELGDECVDFSADNTDLQETLAQCGEAALEEYLADGTVRDRTISDMIRARQVFPCLFGSGLKMEGVDEFLSLLERFVTPAACGEEFGARVFKITHDDSGAKVTHLKITGGTLRVRDAVTVNGKEEKITQIRVYHGAKYTVREEAPAGTVCAVTGLDSAVNGMGLGSQADAVAPVLEPVMDYRIDLPEGEDKKTAYGKLKLLEEEDPMLRVRWNSFLQEIHVGLMGEVQAEILRSLAYDRFGMELTVHSGTVMYKETITDTVEGVGHYEPLRHYAEVHLILEPLPRGAGLLFETAVKQDLLDLNWQRLIMMHLTEKEHLGVLTGSPITDIKITLAAGRAHLKHTEGGDFRQATYRAVRQGLMQAQNRLLEPWYAFTLELPAEHMGRAISDIRMMHGEFDAPEGTGATVTIKGKAPVTEMNGYAATVASFSSGRGRLTCSLAGYFECHNEAEAVAAAQYEPEADLDNTPDSVFCAHGGGFTVKWRDVPQYMHLESCLKKEKPYSPAVNRRNLHIDDKELQAILEREFGKPDYTLRRPTVKETAPEEPEAAGTEERPETVIVDGYNVIFAWEGLKAIAMEDLESARTELMQILCNYAAFTRNNVVLVFDAYRVAGNPGQKFDHNNIHVVFTEEREIADVYIEKLIAEIGKNEKVRVVTSDNLIRLSAVRVGVLRVSAADFAKEAEEVDKRIAAFIEGLQTPESKTRLGDVSRQAGE